MEPVIQTTNLSKSFGPVTALDGLDLVVPRHSITGFLGPNGAGKSTTIKLLLGLMHPTAGSGTLFGLDIVTQSTAIRKRVGYLAQQPSFYNNLTARETLEFVARFFFDDEAAIARAVDDALDLVDLTSKADRTIRGFSGGEMQRLGIAQAQINQPDLLILDEPAAALDPMGRAQVLAIMQRLRERSTIFYSTHILDDVQRVSDRVVILNQGELVAQGPIEDLLAGQEGIVYRMRLAGHTAAAQQRIGAQPWVTGLKAADLGEAVEWHIAVTDDDAARHQLLRLALADDAVDVLAFHRAQAELEDVFMELVGGSNG
ncbi:MAG: ABC transporter ATP-binding protein [Chloroflexi bacterium]|nr:ABC transporter ATP-binding protein [Chloroflexota bacterium]